MRRGAGLGRWHRVSVALILSGRNGGSAYGIRTRVTGVRGCCLSLLASTDVRLRLLFFNRLWFWSSDVSLGSIAGFDHQLTTYHFVREATIRCPVLPACGACL